MFSLFICPGKTFLPAEYSKVYTRINYDSVNYTLCGLCYNTCLDDVERSEHTIYEHCYEGTAFSCDCDKVHNRLESGIYEWGTYDCAKCKTETREFDICECNYRSKGSANKYCLMCSLIKGTCKCGNNMANVDYEYLRSYFCLALGIPLNGNMIGFDLVLYNLVKNRIASELGGYRRHPDTLERKEKKTSRELSYFARNYNDVPLNLPDDVHLDDDLPLYLPDDDDYHLDDNDYLNDSLNDDVYNLWN